MAKKKNVYVVGKMAKKSGARILDRDITVDFSTFEDGACGVLIAFYNKKKAKRFAAGHQIMEMEEVCE